ncbi:MAG: folate-binding protein [Alphaproteobacteria bacterium]|nr:folate-binding protein [Alphaproteobacteria bacterium]
MQSAFFITLKNRGLVIVSGSDRFDFLQGLITNDIRLLQSQPCIYACLLSAQGKFLHDFFITQHGDDLWLECEGGARAEDLHKRLSQYKLRAQVGLSIKPHMDVFVILNPLAGGSGIKAEGDLYPDPRHPDLGDRAYTKPALPEQNFEFWDERRIRLRIPDGSRDLVVGQSTLDEGRMDTLHAVSYEKGCYVGQELTARMHYRGLGKKHLDVVAIKDGDAVAGELRSRCGDIGLALVRSD